MNKSGLTPRTVFCASSRLRVSSTSASGAACSKADVIAEASCSSGSNTNIRVACLDFLFFIALKSGRWAAVLSVAMLASGQMTTGFCLQAISRDFDQHGASARWDLGWWPRKPFKRFGSRELYHTSLKRGANERKIVAPARVG